MMEQTVSQNGAPINVNVSVDIAAQEARIEGNKTGNKHRKRQGEGQDPVIRPKAGPYSNGKHVDPPPLPTETGNLTIVERQIEIVDRQTERQTERQIEIGVGRLVLGVGRLVRSVQDHLTNKYQEDAWLTVDETLNGIINAKNFSPGLAVRHTGHEQRSLENSQHDIFNATRNGTRPRRFVVSGNREAKNTALTRRIAYDWAVQDERSRSLVEKQLCFALSMKKIKPNQKLAEAIKEQHFSDRDNIQTEHIQEMLEKMPEQIVILFEGYDSFQTSGYTGDILNIIQGNELPEATVLVTARPRDAALLRETHGYTHIEMLR